MVDYESQVERNRRRYVEKRLKQVGKIRSAAKLQALEAAKKNGYIVARRGDNPLITAWEALCCQNRKPFIVVVPFVKNAQVTIDWDPAAGFFDTFNLTENERRIIRDVLLSFSREKLKMLGKKHSPISIPDAHELAQRWVKISGEILAARGKE